MTTTNAADVDPLQQLLLAQLAGDPVPTGPSIDDLLAHAPTDPTTAAVLDALRRRREREAAAADESDPGTDDSAEATQQLAGLGPDPGLADFLQRLYDELAILRDRNAALADALGACAACWGSDPWCARCRGRGAPGGRAPVEDAFARYVTPAVQRRGAHRPAVPPQVPTNGLAAPQAPPVA